MNLVAIAILCQVSSSNGYEHIRERQLACQKEYVSCWNKKREEQLANKKPYDSDKMLAECVLERK